MENIIKGLKNKSLKFNDVINYIEENYYFSPISFKNGNLINSSDENQRSAKIFSFAKLNNLTKEDTLILFAEHYDNVLDNPLDNNHQNIREFIKNGWEGIDLEKNALTSK